MKKLTEDVIQKMIETGCNLNKLCSLSRIMQTCLYDEDYLKKFDIEIIFDIFKETLIKAKNDFNEIEKILKI